MNKTELAASRFEKGFACSQAILSAYGEELGLDRDTALKIAAGFGGGMGRMAETCGAVTGAFMVIGLKYGTIDPEDKATKDKTYDLVQEFANRFKSRQGSISCQDLLGYDVSSPEELEAAKEKELFDNICPKLVKEAAEILEEMLSE